MNFKKMIVRVLLSIIGFLVVFVFVILSGQPKILFSGTFWTAVSAIGTIGAIFFAISSSNKAIKASRDQVLLKNRSQVFLALKDIRNFRNSIPEDFYSTTFIKLYEVFFFPFINRNPIKLSDFQIAKDLDVLKNELEMIYPKLDTFKKISI